MRVEQVGSAGQRAGPPPGVVVAERHVWRVNVPYRQVAAQRAEVLVAAQQGHLAEPLSDSVGGVVGGAVVDDHYGGAVGKCRHVS
jgi:hypothetical protein